MKFFFSKAFWLYILCSSFCIADEVLPVAVIGSGPCGLSAALVTSKNHVETHVFLGTTPGGPLNAVTCLGNWPGAVKGKGNVVMERLFEQVKKQSICFYSSPVKKVDLMTYPFAIFTEDGKKYLSQTVIVATGAIPRQLDFPHTFCTSLYKTDAPLYKGQTIAVIGGGIDAVKKASIASKMAKQVYLIVRGEKLQKSRMEKRVQNKGNIQVFYQSKVVSVEQKENTTILKLADPLGHKELVVDRVVLAAGITPNTTLFKGQLTLDEQGYIVLQGRSQQTSIKGVFAGGNATDGMYRQAAISAAEGMKAGYDALAFLEQAPTL